MKFNTLLDSLVETLFQCQDNMLSLITQTIVCLDTCCLVVGAVNALQDQTQTDCPPFPLFLPPGQLGWICTGAQTQCSVKCNCAVYFPSCVFVQKKYVNVYVCTAAEKVGLPFPAVLMQASFFFFFKDDAFFFFVFCEVTLRSVPDAWNRAQHLAQALHVMAKSVLHLGEGRNYSNYTLLE